MDSYECSKLKCGHLKNKKIKTGDRVEYCTYSDVQLKQVSRCSKIEQLRKLQKKAWKE